MEKGNLSYKRLTMATKNITPRSENELSLTDLCALEQKYVPKQNQKLKTLAKLSALLNDSDVQNDHDDIVDKRTHTQDIL